MENGCQGGFPQWKPPRGYVYDTTRGICRSKESQEGLQASKFHFDEAVKEFGVLKNEDKPCVYKKASGNIVVFLVLYVDDMLLIGNDIPMLLSVKQWLGKCFSMKDLGEAKTNWVLGKLQERTHSFTTRSCS